MKVIQLAALFGGAALAAGPLAAPRKSTTSPLCPAISIAARPGCEGHQPKLSSQAIARPSLTFQQTFIGASPIPPRWSSWSLQSTTSRRSARILRAALHTPLQLRHRSSMSLPRLPSACSHRLLPGSHMGLLLLRTPHLQLLAQATPPARPTSLSATSPRLLGLIPPLPLGTASLLRR
jgi:hypothetical protein